MKKVQLVEYETDAVKLVSATRDSVESLVNCMPADALFQLEGR